jgi:Cu-Zn family superoxide dismutase
LGNFNVTDAGIIDQVKTIPDLINLSGPDSIIGRGLVLHAITDPCTNGTVYGARIALCVIGVQNTTQLVNVSNSAVNANQYTQAVCFLRPTIYSNVSGSVWFTQSASGTTVVGFFNQLVGIHGIHVHQFGDLRGNDGLASGSHWNPDNVAHGIPPFTPRHGGDLGNIYSYANDSKAWYYYVNNDILTLSGSKSIVGRTLTVHVDPDNCTPPTGGAGSRISQCVVGLVNTTYNPPPTVPAEIQSTQNISACQTLYPVNATSTPATQTSASTDIQTTTAASNAIALVPLAFLLLAILVFSL